MVESQTSPARAMPRFEVSAYAGFLRALSDSGWSFGLVRDMALVQGARVAYMRHDVDFHLNGIEAIAEAEAENGVASTWYVLLSGPYNPMSSGSRAALRRLVAMGHDIGLHYDVTLYPADLVEALEQLHWECDTLARMTERPVGSICMHQPGLGGTDPFLDVDEYVHPHASRFQDGLLYVSDSCRGWRDETLLTSLDIDGPRRLLLNTHAELWLDGSIPDRLQYLADVIRPNIVHEQLAYLDTEVRALWQTHPGAVEHDRREQSARHADARRR